MAEYNVSPALATAVNVLFRGSHTDRMYIPICPLEVIEATGVNLAEFCSILKGKLLFLPGPLFLDLNAGVPNILSGTEASWTLSATVEQDGIEKQAKVVLFGHIGVPVSATYNFLVRLMLRNAPRKVCLRADPPEINVLVPVLERTRPCRFPATGPVLAELLAQDNLEECDIVNMTLSEEHFRAMASVDRPNMQLKLVKCYVLDDDSEVGGPACRQAAVECLSLDRGPTELLYCAFSFQTLTAGLATNSRVTNFQNNGRYTADYESLVPDFYQSLSRNQGLVELSLSTHKIRGEHLVTLCESIQEHPTLVTLNLRDTTPIAEAGNVLSRTRTLAALVLVNTLLQTVELDDADRDETLYHNEILPCLERNVYLPRVAAIKRIRPGSRRLQVLGRSFSVIHDNTNLVWMFLSENRDVVFAERR